jgi:hypothetical protein
MEPCINSNALYLHIACQISVLYSWIGGDAYGCLILEMFAFLIIQVH